MSGEEICSLGLFDLARLYRRGDLSPVEVTRAHLQRCERLNPLLNAFLLILSESAIYAAQSSELLFRAGVDLGFLQGVPISVKDLLRVRGTRTTAGSRVLREAPLDSEDAWVVRRLRSAGSVIIGKTNLHEFATGDPDPEGPFGLVQNPRRVGYHPGSSSSGTGAAVAAGLGVVGIGTDTGGSVRIPACLCGVAGLKPTTGRISLEGIIPLSWSLDSVGPLARRVRDVAAAMAVLEDSRPMETETSFLDRLSQTVRGWRVGVPAGRYFQEMQPAVREALEGSLRLLGSLGCQVIDLNPPGLEEMFDLNMIITQAEGSTYHERYREYDPLYGSSFRERTLPGRELKAMTYIRGRRRQEELQRQWLALARRFEVMVTPSCPSVAPPHGVSIIEIQGVPVPFRAALSRFTRPFSLLGWPALSIPNGIDGEGLPMGLQIAGPPGSEPRLLTLGHQLEEALGLAKKLGIEPAPS